jgi:hypothetical protein
MTHHPVLHGLAAVVLALTLMVPYAHPVYCDMGMHSQGPGGHVATAAPHHHGGSHHQQRPACHDLTTCGVASVAPVLTAQTGLPTPSTVAYLAPTASDTFVNNPTAPATPPPRV